MIFGRTDLRINLSGAKFDEEADFDVRSAVGPPKPHQIDENLTFRSKKFAPKDFSASKRKIEICKSSETRVAEVSRRSEPNSRGKRTFEVHIAAVRPPSVENYLEAPLPVKGALSHQTN